MTMQAPEFFNVERAYDARDALNKGADALAALKNMAKPATPVMEEADPNAPRQFLAPVHPNTRFLVRKGKNVEAPFQLGSLGLKPVINRDGDLWVEFHSGVASTNDPEILDWLIAHSGDPKVHAAYHAGKGESNMACEAPVGLCREQGPGIDVWAELKAGQEPTATKPATISRDIDIDAFMNGDFHRGNKSLKTGTGRQMADAAASNQAAAARQGRD